MATTPSLLAIFAHPDDEAFCTGGALADCARRAIPTFVISATAGAAGRAGGLAASPEDLARVRAGELDAACRFLGVREHVLLDYDDGRLAEAPFDEAVGRVVEYVRSWRPSVAVTLGREGAGNAHRDHRAICRIATAAVLAAGDELCYPEQVARGLAPHAVSKFYYVAAPAGCVARDGTRFEHPTTVVDVAELVDRKLDAFRLHASQLSLVPKLEEWIESNLRAEHYARVLSRVPAPEGIERDLFSGLE
jgi:N-acetyl-1-D-myo-inositol-2-amino-2-deoxy-alpha-D-glucopyranoside deacetylase